MPLPVLIAGLVKALAANGLAVMADAVVAKGKEWVEEKTGVKLPESASGLTPELLQQLKIAEMAHEEVLIQAAIRDKELDIEADKVAAQEVTKRWEADMASDSWLSKNIRPLTLVFLLGIYTIFALLSIDPATSVNQTYVELLGQWGMLVMSAYFVGRTVEKGVSIAHRAKEMKDVARR